MDRIERTRAELREYREEVKSGHVALDPAEMIRIVERNGNRDDANQLKKGYAGEGPYHGA